ncbi:LOW QUALITY PROTEIN: serine/threonine-protein phosphatase 6 regulatory ankyrin repeat subunit B-like [Bolinopsis microptera]|uniref:LOW QUALITY PROTEIN: serine/threonine-protein phosphatase 6 regulatory ankyrin repeat subunit B-like n=1 Tax=Bolinopsis microptera TaxID=2820187 RepID=UPI0030793615
MYAAWTDKIEMVKHLLNLGSDINLKDNSGWNILHHAVQKASMRTVEYLCVEYTAEAATSLVNAKDPHGMTPLHMAIKRGSSKELISNLFKIVDIDVEIKNSMGKTALMYALEVNRNDMIDIVNIVCQHKNVFSEKDDYGLNISHYAVMSHKSLELIKCLLGNGSINNASLVSSKDNIMVTPFHLAASGGSVELVLFLLKIDKVDVNVNDNSGKTALMHAAKAGKTEVIKALIADNRVEVNYCDKAGRTALMHAAKAGQTEVIKALIADDRVEVNYYDKAGKTALMHAAKAGQTEVIKALTTDDRVEVNYRNKAGRTALMYAAEAGLTEVIKAPTTDDRVEVNYRDKFGKTALIYAAKAGQFKAIKALKTDVRVEVNHRDKSGRTAFMYSAEARQTGVINAITTDNREKLNYRDEFERTELMHAAEAGQTKVIKALAIDDRVNHRDKAGMTALMYAAKAGQIDVIKALTTDDRVKLNHRSKVGMTALMYAAKAGQIEVIKALKSDDRVELNCRDKFGKTALIYAAKEGQTEVIKSLIFDGRVDVNQRDKTESTAFMYAAKAGQIEVIKALIFDGRVEVNYCDKAGKTALMHAAEAGHTEVIKSLTSDDRVEVNYRDRARRTALMLVSALLLAKKEKQSEAAYHLVDNVDQLVCSIGDNSGSTPLILALEENHKHLIHAVVKKMGINNEDVNLTDAKGATNLHTGVNENDIELVKLICQNSNVKNVKNNEGLTPIDIAVKKKLYPILWILVENLPTEEIDINKSYEEGDTLLHFAVKQDNLDAARRICSLHGVKCRENDSGIDPLQLAADSENLSLYFLLCIYKLLGTKVDINEQYRGKRIIHIAAELSDLEEFNYLLKEFSNIDVNARDSEDRTALHIAAANNDVDTAKALCKFPSIQINLGSPLLAATEHVNVDVAFYLLSLPTIDLDIKDSAGNNIFEIVCDLIERSSTEQSASITSKGSSNHQYAS